MLLQGGGIFLTLIIQEKTLEGRNYMSIRKDVFKHVIAEIEEYPNDYHNAASVVTAIMFEAVEGLKEVAFSGSDALTPAEYKKAISIIKETFRDEIIA